MPRKPASPKTDTAKKTTRKKKVEDAVVEALGGANAGSVLAATIDGKLYAYPATADNGYFMFYNKEYFTEDDVRGHSRSGYQYNKSKSSRWIT